ncbi:MAG: hypothetical protein EA391_05545 [Balneolaceae bacterium]|nr:MAG: hypothetical protein EA391_05545 [Balneolaceae bacterium]
MLHFNLTSNKNSYSMKKHIVLILVAVSFIFTGCYHAQISTGAQTSSDIYQKKWAASFIGGLVPPSIVHAEQHCDNGVARVETRHSFLNMVAQIVTFSLYSPMEITVVCAAGPRADLQTIEVERNSSEEVVMKTFEDAIKKSASLNEAVYVSFK